MGIRLSSFVLAGVMGVSAAFGVASCSGGEEEECLTRTRFFAKRVWGPVIAKKCINCHTLYGLAKESSFILQDESNPDFISQNLTIVARIAELEKDGVSLLLRKAAGELDHGGGVQVQKDDSEYAALAELVERIKEPDVCDDGSAVTSVVAYATLLDWVPSLRKASMALVSRWPTPEEEAKVKEGGEAVFDAVVTAMMREEAFYVRLKEIWNDYLLTDALVPMPEVGGILRGYRILPDGSVQGEGFNDFPRLAEVEAKYPDEQQRLYAGVAIAREPLELIAHVVRNDRPFTEILTADYTMVNPYSAFLYGVDASIGFADATDPGEYREARLSITRNGEDIPVAHAGVLTTSALMTRFPTSITSRNRSRANAILGLFLGINARRLAERSIDPTRVTGHNPTMNDANCTVCHTVLDPVAGAFKQWPWVHAGAVARYMPPEGGNAAVNANLGGWPDAGAWFLDMRSPGLFGEAVPKEEWGASERWLGAKMAADQRFALNVVQKMFASLTGSAPISFPSDPGAPTSSGQLDAWEVQNTFLKGVADAFVKSGYDLRAVFLQILKSAYYRASAFNGTMTEDRAAELRGVGTGRILPPEMLDRKIKAVTGLAWSPVYKPGGNRNRALFSELIEVGDEAIGWSAINYGGHQGGSADRFTMANPVMANMAWKMANEMGCYATSWDFMHAAGARRLYPHVELSDVPEDAGGGAREASIAAIKKNIAHLYRQVWGEDVAEGSAPLEELYQLFYDTWKEGAQAVADKAEPAEVPCVIASQPSEPPETPLEEGAAPLTEDKAYTVRAWMAVLTYLLADYRFLYE